MAKSEISNPRPTVDTTKNRKKRNVLSMGTRDSGILIYITEKGIEVDGYYTGFSTEGPLYANLSKPVKLDWSELEKIQTRFNKKRKGSTKLIKIEEGLDMTGFPKKL